MNITLLLAAIASFVFQAPVPSTEYDPARTSGKGTVTDEQFTYEDDQTVPVRIYMPQSESSVPVILFSHGLGGSRNNNSYLGNHWAGRGYAVVFMQHIGSDDAVWKDAKRLDRFRKLKAAANRKSFERRVADVPATLDQLEKWNADGGKLAGKLDLDRIGMCGHSYGAVTTQAICGQNYSGRGQAFTDDRIKAALPMSPSFPKFGNNANAFSKVSIPWMLMTGTRDKGVINSATAESRQKVYQQLPGNGQSFQLVLHDAEHMAFSEKALTGRAQRNPHYHKAILALSSAFWDTYLKEDDAAKKWLTGDKVKSVLETKDKWELK